MRIYEMRKQEEEEEEEELYVYACQFLFIVYIYSGPFSIFNMKKECSYDAKRGKDYFLHH